VVIISKGATFHWIQTCILDLTDNHVQNLSLMLVSGGAMIAGLSGNIQNRMFCSHE
jgi:hypothetical protein